MCSSSSSRRRRVAAAAAAAVLMGHLLELLGADLSQLSGPWASAATSAAKVTHVKERLQRFSHTKGRRGVPHVPVGTPSAHFPSISLPTVLHTQASGFAHL